MVLLVLFVWFVAEIAAFVAVAESIGVLLAVVLVLVVSASGPFLVRRAGLGVLAHARVRLARGEPPERELLDGVVLLAGGALVCIPGFVGDVIGLALLVAPIRHLVIRLAGRSVARHVQRDFVGRFGPSGPIVDVEGRAVDVEGRAKEPDAGEPHPTELPGGDGTSGRRDWTPPPR
jgi:UPF0716 protein FxsA